jgi:murein DD-endopeptidase MepM/ murein hydrolase activator NlpD
MEHKKPKHYSVLIVPEQDSHIRRFEFSRRLIVSMVAGAAAVLVLVFASLVTLAHYYRAYQSTEEARLRAAQFEHERSRLVSRVNRLEGELVRAQRFAAKLDALAREREGAVKTGVGPLEGHMASLKKALSISESGDLDDVEIWRPPSINESSPELMARMDLMEEGVKGLEKRLHDAFARQQDRLFLWSSMPTLWPTRGFITSPFGKKRGNRYHEGMDIAGPTGTPIVAPGDGHVTFTGYKGGYGNTVKIDHGYGITTVYAHCSRIFVQDGDRVKRGEVVAAVGNTGSSTGPHLHYEVHLDGVPVNPKHYLAKR